MRDWHGAGEAHGQRREVDHGAGLVRETRLPEHPYRCVVVARDALDEFLLGVVGMGILREELQCARCEPTLAQPRVYEDAVDDHGVV